MATQKRLALFVEGHGDVKAVPLLVGKLLTEAAAWDCIRLDKPFRAGEISKLSGQHNSANWTRFLKAAAKGGNLGGVLLLLDGDAAKFEGSPFCAASCAKEMANRAKQAGAGSVFSVGVVFARQEFESWLIASLHSLAGKPLPPDNRPGIRAGAQCHSTNLEENLRNAKGELNKHMDGGYKETQDQAALTELLVQDLAHLRSAHLRSFRRLESALSLLTNAIRTGKHIVTPA